MAQELSSISQRCLGVARVSSNLFTSTKQLIRWINQARREAAKFTGCIRALVAGSVSQGNDALVGTMIVGGALAGQQLSNSFATIPGVEMYPYDYANSYLQAHNAGVDKIIDVLDISVSWGATRPTLNWMPWGDLQAFGAVYNQKASPVILCLGLPGRRHQGEGLSFSCSERRRQPQWRNGVVLYQHPEGSQNQ